MKLSEAAKRIEAWLYISSYDYEIDQAETVVLDLRPAYRFYATEYDINRSFSSYALVVNPEGRIINENNEDVVEVSMNAYDNDEEALGQIKEFKKNFYDED